VNLLEGCPTGVKNEIGPQKHAQLAMLLTTPVACRKFVKSMELNVVSKRLLLENRAFILKSRMTQWECAMNIFYIIGVVVVIIFVAGFLGLHV
jgi:hypothetical protein